VAPTPSLFALPTVLAQEATADALSTLLLPLVFLAVLYLLLIRPQSKRRKELVRIASSLGVGDFVVTAAGIHGEIDAIDDSTVDLAVTYDASGQSDVVIRFDRGAIVKVVERAARPDDDAVPDAD
jgi:preprotein translocase subunit YajC